MSQPSVDRDLLPIVADLLIAIAGMDPDLQHHKRGHSLFTDVDTMDTKKCRKGTKVLGSL